MMINLLLACFKLLAGLVTHSGALLADAVCSAVDSAEKICLQGQKTFFKILTALVFCSAAVGIGTANLIKTGSVLRQEVSPPGDLALLAVLLCVVVKEWMYWYQRQESLKLNSEEMLVNAGRQRMEALPSLLAFAGLLAAKAGIPAAEPISAILLCGIILWKASALYRDRQIHEW